MKSHEMQMKVERCHGKVLKSYGYAFYQLRMAYIRLLKCIWYSIWFHYGARY